jgi:transposase
MAAAGPENKAIAARLGGTRRTVGDWRDRFAADRLAGLERDAPHRRRTPSVRGAMDAEIIRKTTRETPPNATQWSTRTLARALGVSKDPGRRVWRDNGLKPHRRKGFKVSNDPRFAEKLGEVVGVYRDPPEHALVLSRDEKSQIQALDRTRQACRCSPAG